MPSTRPRLVIFRGSASPDPGLIRTLQSAFDVVEVEDVSSAREALAGGDNGLVLCPPTELADWQKAPPRGAATILQHIGEGIGVVNSDGRLIWSNAKLKRQDPEVVERFVELCREANRWFNERFNDGSEHVEEATQRQKYSFVAGDHAYEVVVSPAITTRNAGGKTVSAVVGVLWDVTASRKIENKLDAIDAAGSELMKIQADAIARMNMAQRLKWLEDKIVHYVHDLLNFDNFEIRLLDRQSNKLELVIAVGLAPLKIGEEIYAETTGNGISGYVAATGESYICADVRKDPLYREGLDNARSSLTVPLFLHDEVIGVFNAESYTPDVFDETDRRFAEIFGRYIAMAMNILDLMVVERYTTNEQVAETVLEQIDEPLDEITERTRVLLDRKDVDGEELRAALSDVLASTEQVRERIAACARGPRTILGAEQEMRKYDVDPRLKGKRIILADDEPAIRETVAALLKQKGCEITTCKTGGETIDELHRAAKAGTPYDMVISDIKMPDRNGYEVFRAAKSVDKDTPVILMTGFGYDPHHSIVRSSQEGLDSFLFKPFKASQLLDLVDQAMSERAHIDRS